MISGCTGKSKVHKQLVSGSFHMKKITEDSKELLFVWAVSTKILKI